MAGFRRSRYLTCFYCGKRTSTRNDGHVRHFECPNCTATNYLDENGDITDPPISTTTSAAANTPVYASAPEPFPGGGSDGDMAGSSDSVFCATCLKNQHLFISSLAQYFPDDPNHPDTPELERQYFHFRQGLERRYPQVCADCEPAVLERIHQAGYTAKTDHLRRMVNYSRQVRLARPTYLDTANTLGRWLWWSGLFFQLVWQGGVFAAELSSGTSLDGNRAVDEGFGGDSIMADDVIASPGQQRPAALDLSAVQPLIDAILANAGRLQSLCIGAAVAGCWWNPYFVQTVRGFTKPYLGIPTWYTYMAAIVIIRTVLVKMAGEVQTGGALPPATLGLHVFAAVFTVYIYMVASRVIRKDMRPLFAKPTTTPLGSPVRPRTAEQRSDARRRGLETMSDVLDEIAATTPTRASSHSHSQQASQEPERWDSWQPQNGRTSFGNTMATGGGRSRAHERQASDFALGSLRLNDYEAPSGQLLSQDTGVSYAEEMDWMPTQPTPSPHRAFRTYDASQRQPQERSASGLPSGAFSQTPVEQARGPFWYKVPPAPTSVAQRIMSRPNVPRLRQQNGDGITPVKRADAAAAASTPSLFGGDAGLHGLSLGSGSGGGNGDRDGDGDRPTASSVEFAPPRFFAGEMGGAGDDPGNALSDLFSQTFTLGSGAGEEEDENKGTGRHAHGRPSQRRHGSADEPSTAWRLLWLAVVLASAAFLYGLQAAEDGGGGGGDDDMYAGIVAKIPGGALLLQQARPHAHVVAMAAVGLCAVLAASLTSESVGRWRSAAVVRQRLRGRTDGSVVALPSLWAPAVGFLLGLASMGLAGWMAVQMRAALDVGSRQMVAQAAQVDDSYLWASGLHDDEVDMAMLADAVDVTAAAAAAAATAAAATAAVEEAAWEWWHLALLHGSVAVHQIWNMVV